MTPGCDAADLKWTAAQDASGPITYLIYASQQTPVPTASPVGSTTALKFRVPGLNPGETYHFLVRARDSQGNADSNTIEKMVTLDCEAPELDVIATRMEEVGGCDGDGLPDAGETLDRQRSAKPGCNGDCLECADPNRLCKDVRSSRGCGGTKARRRYSR